MKLVIKVGGSLSIDENGPKYNYFRKLLPILRKIQKKNQVIISIGGGKFIRKYYNSIKKLGLSNEEMEWIAVDLLRVNVMFLSFLLRAKPIFSLQELNEDSRGIIGGIKPGRSTDANAAFAAKIINADLFIKLTDVDGIYNKDPSRYSNVRIIEKIHFNDLKKYTTTGKPGSYGIIDKMAADIISENKIKTAIINGKDPKNLQKVINGERIGTIICNGD